jgi:hypothetical protein
MMKTCLHQVFNISCCFKGFALERSATALQATASLQLA